MMTREEWNKRTRYTNKGHVCGTCLNMKKRRMPWMYDTDEESYYVCDRMEKLGVNDPCVSLNGACTSWGIPLMATKREVER